MGFKGEGLIASKGRGLFCQLAKKNIPTVLFTLIQQLQPCFYSRLSQEQNGTADKTERPFASFQACTSWFLRLGFTLSIGQTNIPTVLFTLREFSNYAHVFIQGSLKSKMEQQTKWKGLS